MTSHQINVNMVAFRRPESPNVALRLIDVRQATAGGVSIDAVAASAAKPRIRTFCLRTLKCGSPLRCASMEGCSRETVRDGTS
mgnify:CR=1 FL=1